MEETLLFLIRKRKNEADRMKEYLEEKYNDEDYLFCYPKGLPFKNYNVIHSSIFWVILLMK